MKPEVITTLLSSLIAIIPTLVNVYLNQKNAKKKDLVELLQKDEYERYKTYLVDYLAEVENGTPKNEIQKQRASEIYDKYSKMGRKFVCTRKMGRIIPEKSLIKVQINALQLRLTIICFIYNIMKLY